MLDVDDGVGARDVVDFSSLILSVKLAFWLVVLCCSPKSKGRGTASPTFVCRQEPRSIYGATSIDSSSS